MSNDDEYFCGILYESLIDGPVTQATLSRSMETRGISKEDVTRCLLMMEKSGSIKQSIQSGNQLWQLSNDLQSGNQLWQLSNDLQSGDFSVDADPVPTSYNSDPSSASNDITDLSQRLASTRLQSESGGRSSLSTASLPPPARKRNIKSFPPDGASDETTVKSAYPTSGTSDPSQNPRLILPSQSWAPNNPVLSGRLSGADTSSSEDISFTSNTPIRTPASSATFNSSASSGRDESPYRGRSDSPSTSLPRGQGQIMMQTVQQEVNGQTQSQHMYMCQSQRNPAQQTISVGGINVKTPAPVNTYQHTEQDPRLKPAYDIITKILKVFEDPAITELKPHEVAKKSGVGQTKKDINKTLYKLKEKDILIHKADEGNKNPRWSRNHSFTCTVLKNLLQECAAELTFGNSYTTGNQFPQIVVNHHHHVHNHEHTNIVQAGDHNRIEVTQKRQEGLREVEAENLTEQVVSSVHRNQ